MVLSILNQEGQNNPLCYPFYNNYKYSTGEAECINTRGRLFKMIKMLSAVDDCK